jgi:hypothetical protein
MFRKLTTAFLVGLCFAIGLASAQVITRSVQLSQDPSGPFGVDASNNLYLQGNRHFNASGGNNPPTLGTCTAGVITAGSTDFSGQVTGATAATCAVVFGQAYATAPRCLVTPNNATAATTFVTAAATTGFTFNQTATTTTFNWICVSVS